MSDPNLNINGLLKDISTVMRDSAKKINSALPYYKEQYAIEARQYLERLHTDLAQKPIVIECGTQSPNTLRLRIFQGMKYLVENMDVDGKWNFLRNITTVATGHTYIELSIKSNAMTLAEYEESKKWKEDLMDFLDNAAPNEIFQRRLILTPEETLWLEKEMVQVSNNFFLHRVKDTVSVIRRDPSAIKE